MPYQMKNVPFFVCCVCGLLINNVLVDHAEDSKDNTGRPTLSSVKTKPDNPAFSSTVNINTLSTLTTSSSDTDAQAWTEGSYFKALGTYSAQSKPATASTRTKSHENTFEGKQQPHHPDMSTASSATITTWNDTLEQSKKDQQKSGTVFTVTKADTKTVVSPRTTSLKKERSSKENSSIHVTLNITNCFNYDFKAINGRKGTVMGLFGISNRSVNGIYCSFSFPISQGFRYLHLIFHLYDDPCLDAYRFRIFESGKMKQIETIVSCRYKTFQLFLDKPAYVSFISNIYYTGHSDFGISNAVIGYPKFRVDFKSYNKDWRKHFVVTKQTSSSGHIMTWGYDGRKNYLCVNNVTYKLTLPENHVVVLSFAHFDMSVVFTDIPLAGLWLYSLQSTGRTLIFYHGRFAVIPADVHATSLLFHFKTQKFCSHCKTGFNIFFSFHLISEAPIKLKTGVFNCSSSHYPAYKKHVECNLTPECDQGEDEGEHCPYSSPKCRGKVSSGVKCYTYMDWKKPLAFYGAQSECLKQNGDLAMMKTESEWMDLKKLLQYGKHSLVAWIGVKSAASHLPSMYKSMMKWVDNSIAQNVHVLTEYKLSSNLYTNYEICGVLKFTPRFIVDFEMCKTDIHYFICQEIVDRPPVKNVSFPVLTFPSLNGKEDAQQLMLCPEGHVIHAALKCDYKSLCGFMEKYLAKCTLPALDAASFTVTLFVCDDGTMTLPHSLVCDFRPDCDDASDESFCIHRACEEFSCRNGQCIQVDKVCNLEKDCIDESDELSCKMYVKGLDKDAVLPQMYRLPPPVKIDFDFNWQILQHQLTENEPCPNSHFQCTVPYCLPIYLYCNGVVDCPDGEDEVDCDQHQCPGFYRCRFSSACVHAIHLCDTVPQCPQHDDEWLCHTTCPDGCLCQGHVFRCSKSFFTPDFPQLRYLDANGSNMNTHSIQELRYLIYLNLARCNIYILSKMTLFNLRVLNLNYNKLILVDMEVFSVLNNLKSLYLSGNPLTHVSSGKGNMVHARLRFLDLSWTSLRTFSSNCISHFTNLTHLDISFSQIDTISHTGLSETPYLESINLRGNPIVSYPLDIFKSLDHLRTVLTDDYRLCCPQNLPASFPAVGECATYQMHLSSCDNLIPYPEHRILLYVIMAFALVGNITCLILKICVKKDTFSTPTDFLITNINVMDLLMALHTSMIVIADRIYHQNYFSVQQMWTNGFTCKIAGFVAIVSYHASCFTLFFISVQGFLTAYSHKVTVRVTKRVTLIMMTIFWTTAVVFSLAPVLITDWDLHGHTDNCTILLSSMTKGPDFAFAIVTIVVLHLLLCSFTCLGQMSVLWVKVFHDDLSLSIEERSLKMAEATRLFPIIALDCARRYTFCIMELMRFSGLILPSRIQALCMFFILPTNSAVNPLLYALSVLMEKRRQAAEQRLLQRLVRKMALQKNM